MDKGLIDKQMFSWLASVLTNEGYYLETENTTNGMKYKLVKELRVVSEFIINFNGNLLINGKPVELWGGSNE